MPFSLKRVIQNQNDLGSPERRARLKSANSENKSVEHDEVKSNNFLLINKNSKMQPLNVKK